MSELKEKTLDLLIRGISKTDQKRTEFLFQRLFNSVYYKKKGLVGCQKKTLTADHL